MFVHRYVRTYMSEHVCALSIDYVESLYSLHRHCLLISIFACTKQERPLHNTMYIDSLSLTSAVALFTVQHA